MMGLRFAEVLRPVPFFLLPPEAGFVLRAFFMAPCYSRPARLAIARSIPEKMR